jgi:hypothetical protein
MTSPKLQGDRLLELDGKIEPSNLSEMIILGEGITDNVDELIIMEPCGRQ